MRIVWEPGDRVLYDENGPGTIVAVNTSQRTPRSQDCWIVWDNGYQEIVSGSDLHLMAEDYDEEEIRETITDEAGQTEKPEPVSCKCSGIWHIFGCPVLTQRELARQETSCKEVTYSLSDGKLLGTYDDSGRVTKPLYSGPNGDYTVEASTEAPGPEPQDRNSCKCAGDRCIRGPVG